MERAFRRGVLDRTESSQAPTYTPTDFYTRLDYFATFDEEICQMCGACTIRCPFGAFHHDGTLVEIAGLQVRWVAFDPQNCWGCGLCAATCLTGAIAMTQLSARD